MQKFDVQIALEGIREAKGEWAKAITEFNSDVDTVLVRLLHEAARNFMSPEEVAKHSGLTTKRVRDLMRKAGLNPRDGKTLLSKKASEALTSNAELLGINPHEMDLMSPLAYLPMGEKLKQELTDARVARVTDLPDDPEWDESGEAMFNALADAIYEWLPEGESYQAQAETMATALLNAGWHK